LHRPRSKHPGFGKLSPVDATTEYRRVLQRINAYLDEMEVPKTIIDSMITTDFSDIRWVSSFLDGLVRPPSIAEWEEASCSSSEKHDRCAHLLLTSTRNSLFSSSHFQDLAVRWLWRGLLAVAVIVFLIWLVKRLPNVLPATVVTLRVHRLQVTKLENIKLVQIIMTALYVLVVGGLAAHEALHPSGSNYDYLQLVANLNAHPIASVLGALLPAIMFSPLVYWMFGWILRRNAARFKVCEHCAERIKSDAKVCRYCGRDVAPALRAETKAPQSQIDTPASTTPPGRGKWVVSSNMIALLVIFGLVALLALNGAPKNIQPASSSQPSFNSGASPVRVQDAAAVQLSVEVAVAVDAFARGDYATALRLFRPLANQADAPAQFYVGWMYANGQGVPKNDAEAARWYRLAADQDLASAQYYLGLLCGNGQGVPKNDAAAARWYRKAAEQGYGDAQFNLGVMYAQGRGVPRNDAEAVRWYRLAAEQANSLSQTNLGLMYYEGRGVQQNDAEAVKWWRKAADQGADQAQYNLGLMYDEGRGVQQNYVWAHTWYNLAAKQGNQDAFRNRSLVAQLMTSAQIDEALKFARAWKSKKSFSDAEIGLLPDVSAPKQSAQGDAPPAGDSLVIKALRLIRGSHG
jgi:TPR repeat protein